LIPTTLKAANAFVKQYHRHHAMVRGCKFCLAVTDEAGAIRGVAIVGRPVSRGLDDGVTVEVTRLCTDGARNACSMLYRASWRAAAAMGHTRLVTYILESEDGTSLRAAGMRRVELVRGRSWSCASRARVDKHPTTPKWRWELAA
jgi:hypothetical protein